MERYVIQSAHKTLEVLMVFARPPHRFTLTDIVEMVEMDKNQVFRAVKTLEYADFLRVDADGSIALTSKIHALTLATHQAISITLPRAAAGPMTRLFELVGETVGLYLYDGQQAICIDIIESTKAIRWSTSVGRQYPLHAGAGAKAILSALDAKAQQAFLGILHKQHKYTPNTISDPERMIQEIRNTRERGYAISKGEYDLESYAVAAAIFNASKKVVGSVAVGSPSYRMTNERIQLVGHMVMDSAEEISKELGLLSW